MGQRLYEKRSPFSPDKNHIHHKLLDIGFDHYEAVFIIYVVQTALVSIAYFMRYESDTIILLIYLAFSFAALYIFHYARNTGWQVHHSVKQPARLKAWVIWANKTGFLEKWSINILKAGLPVFFIITMILPDTINKDMAALGTILLLLLVISMVFRVYFVEKVVAYVVCVLSVYLLEINTMRYAEYNDILNIYLVLLAVAFAVKIRFSRDKSFQVTPLDFLVVLLVIVVPNMPEFSIKDIEIGVAAFKLIVLFYACEAVLNIMSSRWDIFRLGLASSLLIVTVRGLI